ncbi:transposase [Streptomyces sp. NPDC056333]|uniref:transposase n=1 Tax=Streptomyces sp. NPDC056333 TaxID=3345786 RepID=UPI0035DF0BDC
MPDRLCLQGILFVPRNDMAWQLLPLELGFGSRQTCRRHLDRWRKTGDFDRLHRSLRAELNAAGLHHSNRLAVRRGKPHRTPRRLRLLGPQHHRLQASRDDPTMIVSQALTMQFKSLQKRWTSTNPLAVSRIHRSLIGRRRRMR